MHSSILNTTCRGRFPAFNGRRRMAGRTILARYDSIIKIRESPAAICQRCKRCEPIRMLASERATHARSRMHVYLSGRDGAERLPKKLLAARLEARESFESRTDLPPAGTVYAAETCSRARNTASCVLVDPLVDHVHVRLIC